MSLTAKTEKDNFSRLGQGIVGTGNTMARDLLTSYISPTDLVARVLPSGRPPHTVWKRLNKDQQEHIRKAVVDGYAKFDFSLVYVLLRNVCTNLNYPTKPNILAPTQGWGKDPTPTDITPSDDMERLRILRNAVYGHASQASIPDTEYQIHWQELKDIASRMKIHLGKDFPKELQETEIYKMTDADVKQMMLEINKGKDEVIKEIKEHLEDTVKEGNTETKEHTENILQEKSRGIKHHTTEIVQNQNREIKQHISEEVRKIIEHITGAAQDNKQSVEQLDIRLLEINNAMTKHTPLAPLEDDGDTMPVDLLYDSVVITKEGDSLDVKLMFDPYKHATSLHNTYMKSLRLIHLSRFKIEETFFKKKAPLLTNMPNLQTLKFSDVEFFDWTIDNTPLLTNLPLLRNLELKRITIRNMSLENAPLITNLPSLDTLKLRDVTIGNMKLTNASLMANLQMLHVLKLYKVVLSGLELNGNPLIINMPKLDTVSIECLCILGSASHGPAMDNTDLLSDTPNLRSVDLKFILDDMKPWFSPDMLHLEKITLENVKFSLEGWKEFIDSLTRIRHSFDVHLKNVETDVKTYIRQSSDFTIRTTHIRYERFYERRLSCRYIGRHVYFGRYIDIHRTHSFGYSGRFIGKAHSKTRGTLPGKTRCKYGRNVDRYVGKCVNSSVGRILYDLSIKRV